MTPGGPKVKPLHWDVIPSYQVGNTIFSSAAFDDMGVSVNEEALVELFNVTPAKKIVTSTEESSDTPRRLLDMRRTNNIEITLRHAKMDPEHIVEGVVELSADSVPVDLLEKIRTCLPTPQEREVMLAYTGDVLSLDFFDYFFFTVALNSQPHTSARTAKHLGKQRHSCMRQSKSLGLPTN